MPSELKDLQVVEVSLVDFPANRRKFLLTKKMGDSNVHDEMLALILETDLENGDEVRASLDGVSDSATDALIGALKLFNAHREEVDTSVLKEMLTKAGILEAETDDGDDDDEVTLLKADGTLNLDDVPEPMRADVERLWKERSEMEERASTLQETIRKQQEEAREKEFIQKAESFTLPTKADELAPVLKTISEKCPDEYPYLEDLFVKSSKLLEASALFEEKGEQGGDMTGDAYEKARKLAEKMIAEPENKGMSIEKAIDVVFRENPDLARDYRKEN
jgi:hypothetical protein